MSSADLMAFSRATRREQHVLIRRPDLLWQQLHNRLQSEEASVAGLVAQERGRRSGSGALWLRTTAPLHESGALVRTLKAHDQRVTSCAFCPDGSYFVSASSDGTLKAWDPGTGREQVTMAGHTDRVNSCAVTPDGRYVVSASADTTLRLWDPVSGLCLRVLRGHARGPGLRGEP